LEVWNVGRFPVNLTHPKGLIFHLVCYTIG
jgi:hypothetical protein